MSLIKKLTLLLSFSLVIPLAHANTEVRMNTSMGSFTLALDEQAAPNTVANFVQYVKSGFYDGLVFHRVIRGFMIQGGGMSEDLVAKDTMEPIPNESNNGLSNERGTIAMARTANPDSATSQFFINLVDNARLDGSANHPGYTVFGKVIEGMDTVDKIAQVRTTTHYPFRDVPVTPVVITHAEILPTTDKPIEQ